MGSRRPSVEGRLRWRGSRERSDGLAAYSDASERSLGRFLWKRLSSLLGVLGFGLSA